MSVLRDLNMVRCNLYRHNALFTLLARWCFVASRITNEPATCIPPQPRLYLPHNYRRGGGIILAVAGQQERWPCNRRGSVVILAVAVPFPR